MSVITGDNGDNSLTGTAGDDTITGAAGNDTLTGLGGNDRIWGNAGNDLLRGSDGDDVVKAGRGADRLFGDAGDDVLHGGEGADTLNGGLGADVFQFKPADIDGETDLINDFVHDLDAIDVSALGTVFVVSQYGGRAGELRITTAPGIGIWAVQYDADGDALADHTIAVFGLVSESDIVT